MNWHKSANRELGVDFSFNLKLLKLHQNRMIQELFNDFFFYFFLYVLYRLFFMYLLDVYFHYTSPVKRICVFEHSVMTNFNCTCPAVQRGQGSGFLSESSSWFTACMSEQRRFWRACASVAARIDDKYQIRLTRSIQCISCCGFTTEKSVLQLP